jgi:hypothetical protein
MLNVIGVVVGELPSSTLAPCTAMTVLGSSSFAQRVTGFVNWSPHLNVDPQPFLEFGYYTEHHKFIVGAIHAGYKNEAILGYAYDFNKTWRAQVDFQSGAENSTTIGFTCNITRHFQTNPALYINNGHGHDLFGYVVFTYTFPVWNKDKTMTEGKNGAN